jgi:glyoxylase I family protein
MTEASFSGIHHVAINVHDLERSERWYAEVLKFTRLAPFAGDRFQRVLMRHPSGMVLGLTRHDDPEAAAAFHDRRTGLDHFAFQVADRAAVEAWVARFDELGVAHTEVKETPITGSSLVVFRDPDGIQLEMYAAGPGMPPPGSAS